MTDTTWKWATLDEKGLELACRIGAGVPERVRAGPVRLRLDNGEEQVFFASGGFLEVQPSVVTVLADTAVRAEDIDEAAAAEAQEAARRALEETFALAPHREEGP